MKKIFLACCFALSCAAAPQMQMPPFEGNQKIGVQNLILTQVNGTTLSIMDVKKKLDMAFHQSYPQLIDSTMARFQFYQNSWRHACMELIDHELILADAEDREIKVSDGEVREELENRFGPNVMVTLDKIGVSYSEAWKMIRSEMIVQRMMWFFIHSKAIQQVTPQDIRQEYRRYVKEHPSYEEWAYRVISVRTEDPEQIGAVSEKAYLVLKAGVPEKLEAALKEVEKAHPGSSISVSTEYKENHLKLSDAHRAAMAPLAAGEFSQPLVQPGRAGSKPVARIFHLSQRKEFPAPSFEELAQKLKDGLIQKAVAVESDRYIAKLRKHYGYDAVHLQESVPETLTPFSLQ